MPLGLHVCSAVDCPNLTPGQYCQAHRSLSPRNHRGVSRQARGYDRPYELERATLVGRPCEMRLVGCTGTATTSQHTDDGRRIPACRHCNFADGARRARAVAR